MSEPVEVLELAPLGVRVEIERTAAQTDGELIEFVVTGRPRGFLAQPHVHTRQAERFQVLSGELELQVGGRVQRLGLGQTSEVPAGAPHRQRVGSSQYGRVRVQSLPAGRTEEFLRRLAQMCADGALLPGGWPRPLAAAELVCDFADEGHAARPSLTVQTSLARGLLRAASREYVFVDEWDVAAPPEATFQAIADGSTCPEWWRPVYLDVDADGPPAPGTGDATALQGPFALPAAYSFAHHASRAAARDLG
jgi:quercetin dioxygenase-like cupin family protein